MRVMGSLAALAAVAFAVGGGAGLLWKDPGLVLAPWSGDAQEVAWSAQDAAAAQELAAAEAGPLPDVEVPSRDASGGSPPAADPRARAQAEPYQTASAQPVRPLAQGERRSAPAPVAAPAPPQEARAQGASATPPVSAPPPRSGVAVQVGAFAERRAADQLVAKLRTDGYSAYAAAGDGGTWRVRVGPFRDRGGAEQAAARLKRDQKLPTWVLEENGPR